MMNKALLRLEHRTSSRWPAAASSLLRIGLAALGVLAASSHADAQGTLIQTSNISCVGTFRIAVPDGSFTDFSHGISAITYRYDSDNKRHYFVLDGNGHVLESVEPTLSDCSTPAASTNFAMAASWGQGGADGSVYGSDWGEYPLRSTNIACPGGDFIDYLPGDCLNVVKPAGLKWVPTSGGNGYLLETWYPTYEGAISGKNSVASATLNTNHTISLQGCWAANPTQYMQQVGGGVITPPQAWVTANSALLPPGPNGYWLLGLGGPTGTVEVVSNGPSMQLVPAPGSGNACTNGTTTAYPTAAGVVLANFAANTGGPTCGNMSLGCDTSGMTPTHPYAAQTAFTGYSQTFSPYWWDPYGGHGWFWGGTSFGMDWYDDSVVHGVLVPYRDVSGWAFGRVLSSPAPTYDSTSQTGTFSTNDPIDTHDAYQPHVGDAIWVQTCVNGVSGCTTENQHDWTWGTITNVQGSSAPYTFTYLVGGLDTSMVNHVPVPNENWWFGPFYGNGAGGGFFPRAMFRLQVIDPNEYTKVLNGTYATSDLPTYHEDIDITSKFSSAQFGGPSTGRGVAQNSQNANANVGPSWAAADSAHQQFLVNISLTDCSGGPDFNNCAQIYVLSIGH